jgi:cob(I)alamin adenosyltransferase
MALNIAALGYFTWLSGNRMFWHCDHTGPDGKVEQILMHAENKFFPVAQKTALSENEVRNSMIIYGSILREEDQSFRREYLKGIVHLDVGFADLTFHREAFANFYRSLELFVTARVLKKAKLRNELKEIQDALFSLGLSKEMCEEFRVLYKMRSEQVMHAQQLPTEIGSEDVLKIKVFADYVLHKYYRSKAEEWREAYHVGRS